MTTQATLAPSPRPTQQDAANWIVQYISKRLEIADSAVDRDALFSELGIDSSFAVVMSGDIGDWIDRDVPPNLLYEHPTVHKLARYIAALD